MPAPLQWTAPPDGFVLTPSAVHVWLCPLQPQASRLAALRPLLAPAERARAERLVRPEDRERWTLARGWLRFLLSPYTHRLPGSLAFNLTAHGRPELAGGDADDHGPVRFNQSHSGDWTLIAVTRRRDIGVDIERVRSTVEPLAIARRFFAPVELAQLQALAPAEQLEGFFRCWTCKEAFIKAVGQGLSYPLDQFEVGFAPGEPCRLQRVHNEPAGTGRWRLEGLPPVPGYTGALVAAGEDWTVDCWEVSG